MSDYVYAVNAPSVVSETIDGEVIIMNLKSGNYYSSDKTGAVIWSWIEAGRSVGDITRLAASRYDAAPEELERALAAFFERLVAEALVRAIPVANEVTHALDAASGANRERFVAPELCAYTDMQDLLLLDPIHDVDDIGWPKPKDVEG
jgi:hypothetical protein